MAIGRATRWVYLEVRQAPFRIRALLTDDGKIFTDRFAAGFSPAGNTGGPRFCRQHGIEHRLLPPYRLHTQGMVERFNGRSDVLATRLYASGEVLEQTLK